MIDRVIGSLAKAFPECTAAEIAEVLWLVTTLPQLPDSGVPVSVAGDEAPSPAGKVRRQADDQKQHGPKMAVRPQPGRRTAPSARRKDPVTGGRMLPATVTSRTSGRAASGASVPVRSQVLAAAARPLSGPRVLAPFMRIHGPGPPEVDIDATVEATADFGRLIVMTSPTHEPGLHVALVVDSSPVMTALGTEIAQFEALLRRAGAFRSVTRWSLIPGAEPLIHDGAGAEHQPDSLADPSGRRLILVVTDAVAEHWYHDATWRVLRHWARLGPTAIVYALPDQYRPFTALGGLPIAMRPRRPAGPNHAADIEIRWWDADPPDAVRDISVPVVALRPDALATWAKAVATGTAWVNAVWARPPLSPRPMNTGLTAEDRVRAFEARASVGAQALARVLAGAPVLSWPLMGVLQTSLLPETGTGELAEVLIGGLLERAASAGRTDAEQFRFRSAVGELLRRGTTATQEWGTFNAVSDYLKQNAGTRNATRARPARPQDAAEFEPFDVLRRSMAGRLGLSAADAPLTHWYELVMLHRTWSGQLEFQTRKLFAPGAEPGSQQPIRIRCELSDEHGTIFAVVATEAGEAQAADRNFRLVSVQSASLDPGVYEPTAVLVRADRVDFRGLSADLRPELRGWSELVATVPARLDQYPPAHLICAIEVSGTERQLVNRVDRVRQLIEQADRTDGLLRVSVISYGPHAFDDEMPDEPTTVLTWGATVQAALSALTELGKRSPLTGDYRRAAQLECMLTTVAARLSRPEGRPVLVTAGFRPPFPPKADVRTLIIPCPLRNDWRNALRRLREVPGIALGAIADPGADRTIWAELGTDAFAWADLFNPRRFGSDLGLRRYAQYVPFPLVEPVGG